MLFFPVIIFAQRKLDTTFSTNLQQYALILLIFSISLYFLGRQQKSKIIKYAGLLLIIISLVVYVFIYILHNYLIP